MKLSAFLTVALSVPPQSTMAIDQPLLRKTTESSLKRRLIDHHLGDSSEVDVTFEDAMAEYAAGNLPMTDCDEELLSCMDAIATSHGRSLGFEKADPSTWGTYSSWDALCGAMTAEIPQDLGCMMCAHSESKYPVTYARCNDEQRNLAAATWQLFDAVKREPETRRGLQEAMAKADSRDEAETKHSWRKLQENTCPVNENIAVIPYPTTAETSYTIIVGPLLAPIALDVSGIDLTKIEFPDDDDIKGTNPPDNPDPIGVSSILANFESRTNQNLVASVMIVGKALEFIAPKVNALCQLIPETLCILACVYNPLRAACFIIYIALEVIIGIYKLLPTAWELHDGVVDGAEINAALKNTETLVSASCQTTIDIADVKTTLIQETDEIDDALACRVVEDITSFGYGCDGFDSNCDTSRLIDECAEGQHPPDIDLSAAMACKDRRFASAEDAKACVLDKAVGTDDCRPVSVSAAIIPDGSSCTTTVEVTATATAGCGERAMFDVTTKQVQLPLDTDAPVVSCTLGAQPLCGNGAGGYVDIKLNAVVADAGETCTSDEDLEVLVQVLSNEVSAVGDDMVLISKSRNATSGVPSIWVEDRTCQTRNCKISSMTRIYIVKITATDKAGLVSVGECSTIVGPQDIDLADPLFLIEEASFKGGFSGGPPAETEPRSCGSFYVDYDDMRDRCAQDCDPAIGLPCKGSPPDDSGFPATLYETVEECCTEKVFWRDLGECVADTYGVPSQALGSEQWFADWTKMVCVKDCLGGAPCGGLKKNWGDGFPSAMECCAKAVPWVPRGECATFK